MLSDKKRLTYALRNNLNMFAERVFQTLRPNKKFVETIATQIIIDSLLRMKKNEFQNLIINIPPRTLKSTIVSVAFTAWILGHDPSARIVCISYNEELAKEFSSETRRIMESSWYKAVFPNTRLNPNKRSESKLETTQNGYRIATSIGGTMTGIGGEWIIIDDPQKPSDAQSDTVRKKTNATYDNTIISRLDNKSEDKIIVVGQRLHVEDFYEHVGKSDSFKKVIIPAIAEKNEKYQLLSGEILVREENTVINPEFEPLEKLDEMKSSMTNYNFSAQYQQNPIPPKGNILDFNDFIMVDFEFPKDLKIFQSWDIALCQKDKSDYSVCVTGGINPENGMIYIIDVTRGKWAFPELRDQIKNLFHQMDADHIIIEDSPISRGLIQELYKTTLPIISHHVEGSKEVRANNQTFTLKSHKILIPKNAHWLDDFKSEILSFPHGRHDDQVDALVQLLENLKIYKKKNAIPGALKIQTEKNRFKMLRERAIREDRKRRGWR